ncbi:hypothetical protein BDD12DRAFT_874344 [Trichophaea hybrida]|nr:hypothetical protein BDD12DRAFT_874344 [Trichophaea hybrida]
MEPADSDLRTIKDYARSGALIVTPSPAPRAQSPLPLPPPPPPPPPSPPPAPLQTPPPAQPSRTPTPLPSLEQLTLLMRQVTKHVAQSCIWCKRLRSTSRSVAQNKLPALTQLREKPECLSSSDRYVSNQVCFAQKAGKGKTYFDYDYHWPEGHLEVREACWEMREAYLEMREQKHRREDQRCTWIRRIRQVQ